MYSMIALAMPSAMDGRIRRENANREGVDDTFDILPQSEHANAGIWLGHQHRFVTRPIRTVAHSDEGDIDTHRFRGTMRAALKNVSQSLRSLKDATMPTTCGVEMPRTRRISSTGTREINPARIRTR